jgi:membrane protein involved in colicin uptake
MNQEKFAEFEERKRLNALRTMRQAALGGYQEYVPLSLDLATLSEEEYVKFRDMVLIQHAENLRHIAEMEQKRKEAAEAAEIERERLAAENAALIEKQKKMMAVQREAARIAEAQIAAQREATRKAQEAADALRREEEARIARAKTEEAARKRAESKAARAPDAAKLQALANEIDAIVVPSMKSEEMQRIADNIRTLLTKTAVYIRQTLETIEKQ